MLSKFSLVVIEVVDVDGVAVLEAEDDAPVGAHRHGPVPREVSLEPVKPEAGSRGRPCRSGKSRR